MKALVLDDICKGMDVDNIDDDNDVVDDKEREREDLPIDDEEWSMDWPQEWAELRDFHESNFHDWPESWPVTIRNFGRWLDKGPDV